MANLRGDQHLSVDHLSSIAASLHAQGLLLRGAVNFESGDNPPCGPSGTAARSVVLVGNAGAAYWSHFSQWRSAQPETLANPLDSWSRTILDAIGADAGARVLMPNDRPFAPFQQWAMRAEALRPSPLGLLIHPVYGLWHAFRGALLFDVEIPIHQPEALNHVCETCTGKPCLSACPVDAYSAAGFAYQRCLDHVRGPDGAPCRTGGCLARNACPVGTEWRYPPQVQVFHQRAFAGL